MFFHRKGCQRLAVSLQLLEERRQHALIGIHSVLWLNANR
jgi:hypothetical protein